MATYDTAEFHLEPAVAPEEDKPRRRRAASSSPDRTAPGASRPTCMKPWWRPTAACRACAWTASSSSSPASTSRAAPTSSRPARRSCRTSRSRSPTVLAVAGNNRGDPLRVRAGQDDLDAGKQDRRTPMPFYIVFDAAVIAVRNGKDDWLKTPSAIRRLLPTRDGSTTTWYAGRARITLTGGTNVWGPWEQQYQVWEASLAAEGEAQVVRWKSARRRPRRSDKAAATAGRQARRPSEAGRCTRRSDYQVFQRKTRSQGAIAVRGRVRQDFDRLECAPDGQAAGRRRRRASGRRCRRPTGRTRSTRRCRRRRAAGTSWRCGR